MKYRLITKKDKFPELPKSIMPIYILRRKNWTYVFGEDEEKRYTFQWDRVSQYFNYVFTNYKYKNEFPNYLQ